MNKRSIITVIIFCLLGFTSCKETPKSSDQIDNNNSLSSTTANDNIKEESPTKEDYDEQLPEDYIIPKTGKSASDFIPKQGGFNILNETRGDLNGDELEDIVIVLADRSNRYISLPMLVLLQNTDKSYRLDKVSKLVMPSPHFKAEYFETEEVIIKEGKLNIILQNKLMSGSMDYSFSYKESELYLQSANTYDRGAGTHSFLTVDFFKGEITYQSEFGEEEDEIKIDKTFTIKPYQYTFEQDCPQYILSDIYTEYISPLYKN